MMAVQGVDPEFLTILVLKLLDRIFDYLDVPDASKLTLLRNEKAVIDRYLQDTGRKA